MIPKTIIPFNSPYLSGNELDYIEDAVQTGHLSGNGKYTQLCQTFFQNRYGIKRCFLTTSCTDALEMAALIIGIKPGDEVIVPSYTFVSTALAFARQGALIRFVDSRPDHPGMNEDLIRGLITRNTKAIVPMHYSGVACDMDIIMSLAKEYNLYVIEDAAHGIESFYKDKPLGSIGHFGCFSFHETKNIHCGEGGMLAVNDSKLIEKAETIWEKGTNRAKFFRGESSFYEWKDTGSSFLPSDLNAAFLTAQIEAINSIQEKRIKIWEQYVSGFSELVNERFVRMPLNPGFTTNNGNSFYLICKDLNQRNNFISHLMNNGIMGISHYFPLHKSQFGAKMHDGRNLGMSERYADTLVRLPLYCDLTGEQVNEIIERTIEFFIKD